MTIKTMQTTVGRVTFSGIPDEAILMELRAARLDCWWSLALELGDLLPQMRAVAAEVLWAKIADYSAPSDEALFVAQLDRVCELLTMGRHVHVSCFGGKGRTGMALACVRVRLERETPDDALAGAHAVCGGPEVPEQSAFVCALSERPLGPQGAT